MIAKTQELSGSKWLRQLHLLGYALGALRRRRQRSVALFGALVSAVALVASVLFVSDALRAEVKRIQGSTPDLVVQKLQAGRPALVGGEQITAIKELPGVADVRPRRWGYVFLEAVAGNITVIDAPMDPKRELPSLQAALQAGTGLEREGDCLLGKELAIALGVRAGDTLTLPSSWGKSLRFRVAGVFRSEVSLFAADVVVVSHGDAQRMLDMPKEQYTDLAIRLRNPDESGVVAKKIATMIPGARVLEKRLLERVYSLSFGRRSGLMLAACMPALLAMLVLAWDRLSGLGPRERREIAILKACGWSTAEVLWVKLYEAILLAVTASALGMVAAYVWAFGLEAAGLKTVLAGWSMLYPTLHLQPQVDPLQIAGILTLSTLPFVALAIGPAWRAALLDPMEAMRQG
jgi:ABC-type lipoprotein release transport system permease subunit